MEGFDFEAGGHRVQRVPVTERSGRVHSSTVTVAVLENGDARNSSSAYANRSKDNYSISWISGTGAGGQHRNKTKNSARITHIPTGIVKMSQTRSRENSLANAMSDLNAELDRLETWSRNGVVNEVRRGQVGTGERSDKRRSWAFQRDTVEDAFTGKSIRCNEAMKGHIDRLWR